MIQFNSQEEMDEFMRKVAEYQEHIHASYTPEQIKKLLKQQEDVLNAIFWNDFKKNCMYFCIVCAGAELLKWYLSSYNFKKSK